VENEKRKRIGIYDKKKTSLIRGKQRIEAAINPKTKKGKKREPQRCGG